MRPKIIDADTGKELWRAVECAKHYGITWSRPVWCARPLPFTGKHLLIRISRSLSQSTHKKIWAE